jgi:Mrp family chromosome partitioning ATPase
VTSTLFRNPLGKRLEEVEWQLKEARTRYTEENPKVVKLREQSEALQGLAAGSEFTGGETTRAPNDLRRDLKVKLQDLVTTLHVAEGRESGLANSITQMESKIAELAALEKQFRQLEARQTSARELERSLSSKVDEALAAMGGGESSLQLVERAGVPSVPEPSPRRLILAASLLLGLLLALGLALLLELVDARVRSREDLEDFVDSGGACTEIARVPADEPASINLASPAFRSFRRFVNDLCASDAEWTSLAIVSAGPGDGRSTVARATALCMAMRGERTALIDADLRQSPGARSVMAAGPGLVEAMQGKVTLEDCLRRGAHERLAIISCSEMPPSEDALLLLGQPEAVHVLGTAASRGRRVVLDLPPAGDDEGAFELACRSGSVILVARHGATSRANLGALVGRLRARGARIVGAVILDVPPERQHPYAGPSASTAIRNELQRLVQWLRTRKAHA